MIGWYVAALIWLLGSYLFHLSYRTGNDKIARHLGSVGIFVISLLWPVITLVILIAEFLDKPFKFADPASRPENGGGRDDTES